MNDYPKFALVKDKKYKINTDYRIALRCNEIAQDREISDEERALAIIFLLYGDEGLSFCDDWNALLKIAIKYLKCGKETNDNKEDSNMDIEQDWGYIRTSFFYDYKIDLENTDMHWWKFFELLCGLGEKCILNRVRFVRDFDLSTIKDNKEREKWKRQKEQVALKTEKTSRELELDKLFEKQLQKGE